MHCPSGLSELGVVLQAKPSLLDILVPKFGGAWNSLFRTNPTFKFSNRLGLYM